MEETDKEKVVSLWNQVRAKRAEADELERKAIILERSVS